MIFKQTKLQGVFEVDAEPHSDERGFFARTWCPREFAQAGLTPRIAQCSLSYNARKGTLRGMHYQAAPFAEAKLVRCARGAIFDVALDLRPDSPTYKQWHGSVLSGENLRMLFIPEGCAHGFITLENDSEIFYQISEFYDASSARGVRWDDPAFNIAWPEPPQVMSERDRTYPDFQK